MNKLQKRSLAAEVLAVVGAAASVFLGLDWLLIASAVLMAVGVISTFYLASKAKKYKRIFSARRSRVA